MCRARCSFNFMVLVACTDFMVAGLHAQIMMLHYIKKPETWERDSASAQSLISEPGGEEKQGESLGVPAHRDTGILSCFSMSPFSRQSQEP